MQAGSISRKQRQALVVQVPKKQVAPQADGRRTARTDARVLVRNLVNSSIKSPSDQVCMKDISSLCTECKCS